MTEANPEFPFSPQQFEEYELYTIPGTFLPHSAEDIDAASELDSPLGSVHLRETVWENCPLSAEPEIFSARDPNEFPRKSNILRHKRTIKKNVTFRNSRLFIVHVIPNRHDEWVEPIEVSPVEVLPQAEASYITNNVASTRKDAKVSPGIGTVTISNSSYNLPGRYDTSAGGQYGGTQKSDGASNQHVNQETESNFFEHTYGEKIRLIPTPADRKRRRKCWVRSATFEDGRVVDISLFENSNENFEVNSQIISPVHSPPVEHSSSDGELLGTGEVVGEEQVLYAVPSHFRYPGPGPESEPKQQHTPKVSIWSRISHFAHVKLTISQTNTSGGRKSHLCSPASFVASVRRLRHERM